MDTDSGDVRLKFLARPEFANRHGSVGGGFLAAMIDSTTAAPLLAKLPPELTAFTTELHVAFVSRASTGELYSTEGDDLDPDGSMPAFVSTPGSAARTPAVLLLMEAFGLTPHIRDVAARIASEGYVVLTPDHYYRELPSNKFGYHEVDKGMAMMVRLEHARFIEDVRAALAYLKSRPDVDPGKVGVTGFCMGGGLTFLTACELSNEIAAAAPFYGVVRDRPTPESPHWELFSNPLGQRDGVGINDDEIP